MEAQVQHYYISILRFNWVTIIILMMPKKWLDFSFLKKKIVEPSNEQIRDIGTYDDIVCMYLYLFIDQEWQDNVNIRR